MDLRTQFEKETGHNRVGIELAATETSAYIRWLESQYQSQSTRIRELEGAASKLAHLHMCEMEGLSSGQPTPEEWMDAVDALSEALRKTEKEK